MNLPIVGLAGLPGSGKDCAARYLVEHRGFYRLAFGDHLKFVGDYLLKLPPGSWKEVVDKEVIVPGQDFSYRYLWRILGTEVGRYISPNVWLNAVKKDYVFLNERKDVDGVVITDVRFENEAHWIRNEGGLIIHITRPGVSGSNHQSDLGFKIDHAKDAFVENDGSVAELHRKVRKIYEQWACTD